VRERRKHGSGRGRRREASTYSTDENQYLNKGLLNERKLETNDDMRVVIRRSSQRVRAAAPFCNHIPSLEGASPLDISSWIIRFLQGL